MVDIDFKVTLGDKQRGGGGGRKGQTERAVVGSAGKHSPLSEVLPLQQVKKMKISTMIIFAMLFP